MNGQAPARASPGQWLQANLSWASLKSGQVDFGTEVAPDKASGSASTIPVSWPHRATYTAMPV